MEATGYVHRIQIAPGVTNSMACAWIGPNPVESEFFAVHRLESDSAHMADLKTSIINALVVARAQRLRVGVMHTAGVIDYITIFED